MQCQTVGLIKELQTHKTLINHEVSGQCVCMFMLKIKQPENLSSVAVLFRQFIITITSS